MERVLNKIGELSVRSLYASPGATAGQAVVMIHGGGQDWWVFEDWMPRFASRGIDVHALSLRGRGDSWPMPTEQFCTLTVADYRDDILQACKTLGLRAPVLLGHSLGGIAAQMAAQALAEAGSTCAGLVLVSSAGPAALGTRRALLPADELVVRPAQTARERYFHSAPPDVVERIIARLVPESPGALNTSGGRAPVDTTRVNCPVLSISGARDATDVPPAWQLAELYAGTSLVLAETGHNIMQEASNELACQFILQWLQAQGVSTNTSTV